MGREWGCRVWRTYWAMPCRARVFLWVTLLAWVGGGASVIAAAAPDALLHSGTWVTPSNLLALVGLLLSAGAVWQQWQDARTKLQQLGEQLRTLKEEHLPETYVRLDVFEARFRQVERRRTPRESTPDESR